MKQVCILGGLRSYIGVENGIYRKIGAEQLGAYVIREVIKKYGIPMKDIDFIVAGNSVGAGGNLTRLMMLEAGLPAEISAMTVDVQCGSGLEAVTVAAAKIESGLADVVIAGGFESCSTKPLRIRNDNHPDYIEGGNNQYCVAKFEPGRPDELTMLKGAEQVAQAWKMDKEYWMHLLYKATEKRQRQRGRENCRKYLHHHFRELRNMEGMRGYVLGYLKNYWSDFLFWFRRENM